MSTQTTWSSGLVSLRSPWVSITRYQMAAKRDQEIRKEVAKLSRVQDHGRSIIEVKKSFRNLS